MRLAHAVGQSASTAWAKSPAKIAQLDWPVQPILTTRSRRSRNQTGCVQATKILGRASKFWMIRRFTSARNIPASAGALHKPCGFKPFGPAIIALRRHASHQILRTKCKESTHKGLWPASREITIENPTVYGGERDKIIRWNIFVDLVHRGVDEAKLHHRTVVLDESGVRRSPGG
jgi:hypothetical protein